ncbi:MAG: nucleoside hydrolase [Phocaeicola sp.]|uniref:nucleoside hydrolase n=1 Tax=Phocaeicola sp. TaxID=2773926 RepID=UPI003FA03FE5
MKWKISLVICCMLTVLFTACGSKKQNQERIGQMVEPKDAATLVIFDTDMGNDVDDALALDMLYKYQDAGKIKILAIMTNKCEDGSAKFLDIMNTWYDYPDIPIGVCRNGADCSKGPNYALSVCMMNLFPTTIKDYNALPDAEKLYRQILSAQPDGSVVIISTGFSTNLARLLDTQADEYSKLTGKELLAQKVKYMSLMAGAFKMAEHTEYNIIMDIPAAKKLFAESPVRIITSPFEVGLAIEYPGASIENDFTWAPQHPMIEAYKAYMKMPYNRPTWDLTAVLEVLEPNKFMTLSEEGKITVADDGITTFTPQKGGNQYYLMTNDEQNKQILDFFLKIIPSKPKNK